MTMKIIKRCLAIFITILLCLNINVLTPLADEASVTIGLSDGEISMGEGVSATVNVNGSGISAYTIYVSYDSSVLQFNSASGSAQAYGGGGTLTISGTGAGSVSLSFTAVGNGTSSISTSGSEVYNINIEQIPISHAGVSVTVATQTTEAPGNNTGNSNNTTESTEEDNRSSNCNLASLQISPGTLEPAFSYSTTSYFVQVEEDVTSMVVSATAEDEKAYVEVWGANLIEPGENTVRITVTAENGAVKVYNIRVVAGEDLGDPITTVDGKLYSFVDDEDEIEALEGFTATTLKYEDWEVLAYESPNKKFKIVPLVLEESEDGEYSWFIYDEADNIFSPYQEYSAKYIRYIIRTVPEGVAIPEGFVETEITINANKVKAYQSAGIEDKNVYLVYAMNISGEEGFYLYDMSESSFMRYVPVIVEKEKVVVATPTEATPTTPTSVHTVPTDEGFFTKEVLFYILCGVTALLIVFIIILICVACKNRNLKDELEDAESMVAQLSGVEYEDKKSKKKSGTVADVDLFDNTQDNILENTDEYLQDKYLRDEYAEIPTLEGFTEEETPIVNDIQDSAFAQVQEAEIPQVNIPEQPADTVEDIDYEKRSQEINDKIKENYDANMDSAFADDSDNK